MNQLESFFEATHHYLKFAYPDGVPDAVMEKVESLKQHDQLQVLLDSEEVEKEASRYHVRLGNYVYPHMKLVVSIESGQPIYYVDAHDSHFSVPESTPGYDKLLAIRQSNKKMKDAIENAWDKANVPLFGKFKPKDAMPIKKGPCNKVTVMAIDDEFKILDMLGMIVSSLGATFLRADSIAEAKKTCHEHPEINLIFCDVMMPVESGYDFVAWMEEQHIQTPVYLITGMTLDSVVKKGVVQVLQKPFSAKSIMKLVRLAQNKALEH